MPVIKSRFIQFLFVILCGAMAQAGEPSAKTLKKCPLGHDTLKDVPIVYGLLAFDGPAGEKANKAIENLEFVPGGCVSSVDSPKHQVICTTCRFAHSILFLREPKFGHWTRTSPDALSFSKPFNDLVKSFPVPAKEQQMKPVTYTQSLNDALEIQFEGINYTTKTPVTKIKADVNKWLDEHHIECKFSSHTHKSTLNGAVRDILEWETKDLFVMINLHHEHSDKTSWVDATIYRQPKSSGENP